MLKELEHSVFNIISPDHGCGSDGGLFHLQQCLFRLLFYILFSGVAGLLVYAVQQLRKGEKKP